MVAAAAVAADAVEADAVQAVSPSSVTTVDVGVYSGVVESYTAHHHHHPHRHDRRRRWRAPRNETKNWEFYQKICHNFGSI